MSSPRRDAAGCTLAGREADATGAPDGRRRSEIQAFRRRPSFMRCPADANCSKGSHLKGTAAGLRQSRRASSSRIRAAASVKSSSTWASSWSGSCGGGTITGAR